jgi:hypothetical protein
VSAVFPNNGDNKPSNTSAFSGFFRGGQPVTAAGAQQAGGWNSVGGQLASVTVLQALPSAGRIRISGPGVSTLVDGVQYKGSASLASRTLQLTAATLDSQNGQANASPVGNFVWVSRNANVATVNSDGLVSMTGRGEVEISCRYPRQVNSAFDGAPSAAEFVEATLQLTVRQND